MSDISARKAKVWKAKVQEAKVRDVKVRELIKSSYTRESKEDIVNKRNVRYDNRRKLCLL